MFFVEVVFISIDRSQPGLHDPFPVKVILIPSDLFKPGHNDPVLLHIVFLVVNRVPPRHPSAFHAGRGRVMRVVLPHKIVLYDFIVFVSELQKAFVDPPLFSRGITRAFPVHEIIEFSLLRLNESRRSLRLKEILISVDPGPAPV